VTHPLRSTGITGNSRNAVVISRSDRLLRGGMSSATHLMTDELAIFGVVGAQFAGHSTVNHSADEYVRLGGFVHTNTAKNYFSILKRCIYGVYQRSTSGSLTTIGLRPASVSYRRRHSHPDCRSLLTLIVARHFFDHQSMN